MFHSFCTQVGRTFYPGCSVSQVLDEWYFLRTLGGLRSRTGDVPGDQCNDRWPLFNITTPLFYINSLCTVRFRIWLRTWQTNRIELRHVSKVKSNTRNKMLAEQYVEKFPEKISRSKLHFFPWFYSLTSENNTAFFSFGTPLFVFVSLAHLLLSNEWNRIRCVLTYFAFYADTFLHSNVY